MTTEQLTYSRKEAAALIGVHPTTVDRMARERRLRAITLTKGGRPRFLRSDIEKALQ